MPWSLSVRYQRPHSECKRFDCGFKKKNELWTLAIQEYFFEGVAEQFSIPKSSVLFIMESWSHETNTIANLLEGTVRLTPLQDYKHRFSVNAGRILKVYWVILFLIRHTIEWICHDT